MHTPYRFQPNESEAIIRRFGEPFYEKAGSDAGNYAAKWGIRDLRFIPSYSTKLVFTGFSEQHGGVVLKIGDPANKEMRTEYYALQQYDGGRFCRVLDEDLMNGIFLEEYILTGNPLREEHSLSARLNVFSAMYAGLHVSPVEPERYPTYTGWVSRITDYMSTRQDCPALQAHMKQACGVCFSMAAEYPQMLLLHGDLHHDNILLGENGSYRIIDPKGVVGDPVWDVPRFILNEFDDEKSPALRDKIESIIAALEQKLGIPNAHIRQCLYVETTMGCCWSVEGGATPAELEQLLETVEFAASLLRS